MRIHLTEISKFAEKVLLPAMYSLRKDEVGRKGRISIFLPTMGGRWSTLLLLQDSGDAKGKGAYRKIRHSGCRRKGISCLGK
ncbi:hypothetical protein CEXT_227161 [Caerostris extrusa]|uniref:Uncharacterized protein n=1 Tax=Caerostris extrusa TaxID=172846 RepID=A0AAV4NCZ3_CAEEX|nr:hypothetical protein CEXT_227161 [Caerostris extrusa]